MSYALAGLLTIQATVFILKPQNLVFNRGNRRDQHQYSSIF